MATAGPRHTDADIDRRGHRHSVAHIGLVCNFIGYIYVYVNGQSAQRIA
jgi:hypothetical protein